MSSGLLRPVCNPLWFLGCRWILSPFRDPHDAADFVNNKDEIRFVAKNFQWSTRWKKSQKNVQY